MSTLSFNQIELIEIRIGILKDLKTKILSIDPELKSPVIKRDVKKINSSIHSFLVQIIHLQTQPKA
ncbi:hypothetical protein [Rhizosphaericola mali]|uniref:Uncharacterized protein n=1 Tax=Rhizosphaericola mali TaxID=2545455 RepID=A0A5P2GB88_9BACT|nr:hypothetical protein [Rhizosphaericola mali]QES88821.1 hypothetical protein E0W69_009200 [Rhizosphaericola mali]